MSALRRKCHPTTANSWQVGCREEGGPTCYSWTGETVTSFTAVNVAPVR